MMVGYGMILSLVKSGAVWALYVAFEMILITFFWALKIFSTLDLFAQLAMIGQYVRWE
jgi:hypothetical protein